MKAFGAVMLALVAVGGCFVVTDFDVSDGVIEGAGGFGGGAGGGEGGAGLVGERCKEASDCATHASDGDCQRTRCVQNRCIVEYVPEGQLLPVQTLGDCKERRCDGMGVVEVVVDPDDVQVDANDCTEDICVGDEPDHVPEDDGTVCGASGSLTCSGGVCTGCAVAEDCGVDSGCVTFSCNAGVCATTQLPDGELCEDDGVFCNGYEVCQNTQCLPTNMNPCPDVGDGDQDCSEACNEGAQSCSAPDPDNSACDDGLYCNGGERCMGGACVNFTQEPCKNEGDGDFDCTEACDEEADDCSAPDTTCDPCSNGMNSGNCINGVCNPFDLCPY